MGLYWLWAKYVFPVNVKNYIYILYLKSIPVPLLILLYNKY